MRNAGYCVHRIHVIFGQETILQTFLKYVFFIIFLEKFFPEKKDGSSRRKQCCKLIVPNSPIISKDLNIVLKLI